MGDPMSATIAERIREFNRFYTSVIGVVDDNILGSAYSLPEARILYELRMGAPRDAADLRREIGIDAGYLSRVLSSLEEHGLLSRSRSAVDGRRRVIALTAGGRRVARQLDTRSAKQIAELLDGLAPAETSRLVEAIGVVTEAFRPRLSPHQDSGQRRPGGTTLSEPALGDLGWIVERHGAMQARDYGWDQTFESLIARIVADFGAAHDPARERAWIAHLDGRRAGSVMCVRGDDPSDPDTARLRLLLVEHFARGCGVGTALVDTCVGFARDAGYGRIRLWTVSVLTPARRIYERAGFRLAAEAPESHWGQDLLAQTWERALR